MRRILLLVVVLLLLQAAPVAAYDPDARDVVGPADAVPVQMPEGLYRVTEVYAGDVVSRAGDVTRYETLTEHHVTDTFARVIDQVGTGARSSFDGDAFNGRATLSNGAAVAGTYYQNFVFDGAAYVPVSIVFFQDDAEVARHARALAAPPGVVPTPPPALIAPTPPPARTPPVLPTPAAPAAAPAAPLGPVRVGVDPTGGDALLTSLEVARGARYGLRVNARGATLVSWTVVGGTNDAVNAAGWHAPGELLVGEWLRLPPPGTSWRLDLRVRVAGPTGVVEREGAIAVWVRAPAVTE